MKELAMVAVLVSLACGSTVSSPGSAATVAVSVQGPGRVLSIPPGIECPRVCTAAFPTGATVTFAAVPADDGAFRDWSGDCAGATGCELSLTGGVTVVARFDAH